MESMQEQTQHCLEIVVALVGFGKECYISHACTYVVGCPGPSQFAGRFCANTMQNNSSIAGSAKRLPCITTCLSNPYTTSCVAHIQNSIDYFLAAGRIDAWNGLSWAFEEFRNFCWNYLLRIFAKSTNWMILLRYNANAHINVDDEWRSRSHKASSKGEGGFTWSREGEP